MQENQNIKDNTIGSIFCNWLPQVRYNTSLNQSDW